ncbi:MAG TPA: substrate-binding domain-containing protein [Mucilaginibacter sp.]|nr:substrate-binding domain-containing protein [Mucilaginibacter sp.]
MKNKYILLLFGILLTALAQSCNRKRATEKEYTDTYNSGTLVFAADESFAPILDEELYIFKYDNPHANPVMIYRPEAEVVKLLLEDSTRFAFLSRDLTPQEKKVIHDRNLPVVTDLFAIDAIAVIANQASPDTGISVRELKDILSGNGPADKTIVFDNPSSSLVRYLKDSTGVTDLSHRNVYALRSNKEVIEYVSKNPDAIGITGYSWLNDPDADYADAVKKIKILAVKDENNKKAPDQYFRPSQTTLYLKQYPLRRSLYIVNCTGRKGLGEGMEGFIESDKGQRIILRSGLLPVLIQERNIRIHSDKL